MSVVYFITAPSVKMVKIGVTTNLSNRLADLQAHSPVQLKVAATVPGDITVEQAMHARFAIHRAHGEWFRLKPEIVRFIGEINAGAWTAVPRPGYVEMYDAGGRIRATPNQIFSTAEAIFGKDWVTGFAKAIGVTRQTVHNWRIAAAEGRCVIPQNALRGLLRAKDAYVATLRGYIEQLRDDLVEPSVTDQ